MSTAASVRPSATSLQPRGPAAAASAGAAIDPIRMLKKYYPLLIGASRKRFLAPFTDKDSPSSERDFATAVVSALAAQSGVWGVRVHDVASTASALDVWAAWNTGGVHA